MSVMAFLTFIISGLLFYAYSHEGNCQNHDKCKNDKSDSPSGRHINIRSHKAQKQACHSRRAADQILRP